MIINYCICCLYIISVGEWLGGIIQGLLMKQGFLIAYIVNASVFMVNYNEAHYLHVCTRVGECIVTS